MEIRAKEIVKLKRAWGLKEKEKFSGLINMGIPVCNSAVPLGTDYDICVKTLIGTDTNPITINDPVGLSRATTDCVAACLSKDSQISASFEGPAETILGVNFDLLNMDRYKLEEPRRFKTNGTLKGPSTLLSIQLQDTTLLWAAIDSIQSHKICKRHYNLWHKKQQDDPTLAFRPNRRFRKHVARDLIKYTPEIRKFKPGMIIPIQTLYEVLHASPTSEFWDMNWCSPQPISQPTPTECPCPKKKCRKERNRRVRKTEKHPNL